jgi:hypothetical protein
MGSVVDVAVPILVLVAVVLVLVFIGIPLLWGMVVPPPPATAGWTCFQAVATVTPAIIPVEVSPGMYLVISVNADSVCVRPGTEGWK